MRAPNEGQPILTVDEEIYWLLPSLVVAIVAIVASSRGTATPGFCSAGSADGARGMGRGPVRRSPGIVVQ